MIAEEVTSWMDLDVSGRESQEAGVRMQGRTQEEEGIAPRSHCIRA